MRAPLWPLSCLLNVDSNRAGGRSQHQTSTGTDEPLINKSNGTVTALGTEPPHAGAAAAPARPAFGVVRLAEKQIKTLFRSYLMGEKNTVSIKKKLKKTDYKINKQWHCAG